MMVLYLFIFFSFNLKPIRMQDMVQNSLGDTGFLIAGRHKISPFLDRIVGIAHGNGQASKFQHFQVIVAIPDSHDFRSRNAQILGQISQSLGLADAHGQGFKGIVEAANCIVFLGQLVFETGLKGIQDSSLPHENGNQNGNILTLEAGQVGMVYRGKFDFGILFGLGIDFLTQDIVGIRCEEDQIELGKVSQKGL